MPVDSSINRRELLTLMGASMALAGLTGCVKQPAEKIFPYVRPPEEFIPGEPLYYATAQLHGGYARGIVVESYEGRPTKIEGNELHPASKGGDGRLRPGFPPQHVRPGSLADSDRARRDPDVELVHRGDEACARAGTRGPRRGAALPDADGDLADAAPADAGPPGRSPQREVGLAGSRPDATTSRRARGWPSESRSRRGTRSTRRTSSSRSTRTSWEPDRRCRGSCVTSSRGAAAATATTGSTWSSRRRL